MPYWLSGLIQQKDEISQRDSTPNPPIHFTKETTINIQKSEENENENKITNENPSSILTLLKGKDNLQSSILELIQELAKNKQNIQQATITLIQDQQNSDLLIKVTKNNYII